MKKEKMEKLTKDLLAKIDAVTEEEEQAREEEGLKVLQDRLREAEQRVRDTKQAINAVKKKINKKEREEKKKMQALASGLEGLGINPSEYGIEAKAKTKASRRTTKSKAGRIVYLLDGKEQLDAHGKPWDMARYLYYNSKGSNGSNKDGRLSVADFERELAKNNQSLSEFSYTFQNGKTLEGVFQEDQAEEIYTS